MVSARPLTRVGILTAGNISRPPEHARKNPSVFATIVIVLPSRFTGGTFRISHGDCSETHDLSKNKTSTSTTVLAWYTGVTLDVSPITDGHQLTLHYALIHTATSAPTPGLSLQDETVSKLRRNFTQWNEMRVNGKAPPSKFIFLLDGKYSTDNLRGELLTGADSRLVALLQNVGKLHGLHIGLANLTCIVGGYGEHPSSDGDNDNGDDDDGFDIVVTPDETDVSITNLVSLDGRCLRTRLEHDLAHEGIPSTLVQSVTSRSPDKQYFHYVSHHSAFCIRG